MRYRFAVGQTGQRRFFGLGRRALFGASERRSFGSASAVGSESPAPSGSGLRRYRLSWENDLSDGPRRVIIPWRSARSRRVCDVNSRSCARISSSGGRNFMLRRRRFSHSAYKVAGTIRTVHHLSQSDATRLWSSGSAWYQLSRCHISRRMDAGSVRIARRVGTQVAHPATSMSTAVDTTSVDRSRGGMP